MIIQDFGKLSDGRRAGLYILKNKNGMSVAVTNYGATLVDLVVPDMEGSSVDVVLGYDDAAAYEKGSSYIGGTVGRYANRIGGAVFELNGQTYHLTANDGPNTLHGGRDPYVHRLWEARVPFTKVSSRDISAAYARESIGDERMGFEKLEPDSDSISFVLVSPDGDQGFPGELRIEVTYTLTDRNELHIDYRATLENAQGISTPLNLTNHSYFNLNGHDSGTVIGHRFRLNAGRFTISDDALLPTGELVRVGGTPMDFRTEKRIGKDIDTDYEPLEFGRGYDHNFVIAESDEIAETAGCVPGMCRYKEIAELSGDRSGIHMTVQTDLPGVQMYTANSLDNEHGKYGAVYGPRSAVCLETQFWPDALNKANFPGGILSAGEEFRSRTTYSFTAHRY